MVTPLITVASVITGIIVGCWLTLVVATTAMSRSQEHMEKRVRYWQARARPPRPADELEPGVPDYWPEALAGQRSESGPGTAGARWSD